MVIGAACFAAAGQEARTNGGATLQKDTGYRGIWYPNQATHDEYVWKYSGGLGTYPQQQEPIAITMQKGEQDVLCVRRDDEGRR